jgi:hypothetical protein
VLKFETISGRPIWLNPTHVAAVTINDFGVVLVQIVGDPEPYQIKGDAEHVALQIGIALSARYGRAHG